jgi:hypothetical protein
MMFVIVVSNLKTREIVSAVGPFETEQEAQTFAADHDGQNRTAHASVVGLIPPDKILTVEGE